MTPYDSWTLSQAGDRTKLIFISHASRKPLIELPQFLLSKNDSTRYKAQAPQSYMRVPQEVKEVLCDAKPHELFEFKGWMWHRDPSDPLGTVYRRAKYIPTSTIVEKVTPYLDSLDGLIGRTVPAEDALPPYESNPNFNFFVIPEQGADRSERFVLLLEEHKGIEGAPWKDVNLMVSLGYLHEEKPTTPLTGRPWTYRMFGEPTKIAEFSYRLEQPAAFEKLAK